MVQAVTQKNLQKLEDLLSTGQEKLGTHAVCDTLMSDIKRRKYLNI